MKKAAQLGIEDLKKIAEMKGVALHDGALVLAQPGSSASSSGSGSSRDDGGSRSLVANPIAPGEALPASAADSHAEEFPRDMDVEDGAAANRAEEAE